MASEEKKDDEPMEEEEWTPIDGLVEKYYGEGHFEEVKEYERGKVVPILTGRFEESIKFRVDYPIEKVNEVKNIKTPDFISLDRKVIIESTSIVFPTNQGEIVDEEDSEKWHNGTRRVTKINEVIEHATVKNFDYMHKNYGYDKKKGTSILFVEVDPRIARVFGFYDELEGAIKASIFIESGLSAVVFITESSGLFQRAAFVRSGSDVKLKGNIPITVIG